jgi:hypothetical protein
MPPSAISMLPQSVTPTPTREWGTLVDENATDSSFTTDIDDETPSKEIKFRRSLSSAANGDAFSAATATNEELSADDASKLEALWQCPICLDLPKRKVMETSCCAQIFCETCILNALAVIPDRTCPLCRQQTSLKRNEFVEALLASVPCFCFGCDLRLPRAELDRHESQ